METDEACRCSRQHDAKRGRHSRRRRASGRTFTGDSRIGRVGKPISLLPRHLGERGRRGGEAASGKATPATLRPRKTPNQPIPGHARSGCLHKRRRRRRGCPRSIHRACALRVGMENGEGESRAGCRARHASREVSVIARSRHKGEGGLRSRTKEPYTPRRKLREKKKSVSDGPIAATAVLDTARQEALDNGFFRKLSRSFARVLKNASTLPVHISVQIVSSATVTHR